ncbi:MAG: transposase [Candidatus Taylorbacteria bacterium]
MNEMKKLVNVEKVQKGKSVREMVMAAKPEQMLALMKGAGALPRTIGIAHRVKQKKNEEPRPTLVAIKYGPDDIRRYKLETEQDEMDFLNGHLAIKWGRIDPTWDISEVPHHQIIFRSAKEEDVLVSRHASQCRYETKKGKKGAPDTKILIEIAEKMPVDWIGLEMNDKVAMILGGSGDYLAYALSFKLSEMGGSVIRIPPFKLQAYRGQASKDDDDVLLARLAEEHRTEFYETFSRDLDVIDVRNKYRGWKDAMKARIGCEQRLFQSHIGTTFCSEAGYCPEGSIKKDFEKLRDTDAVLVALEAEETRRLKELTKAVEALDVYKQIFEYITGLGPRIAARLVYAVVDIRRFKKASQFVAYLGLHVRQKDKNGKDLPTEKQFPRRRGGEIANWDEENGRQAFWNLADQFNRQKGTTRWSAYLLETKKRLRLKHPTEVIVTVMVDGKEKKIRRYTNGHIHKMAIWRTLTRFAEWLHGEWWKLERSMAETPAQGL